MAKRRRRRRNPRFAVLKVHKPLDIGTLAQNVCLKGTVLDLLQDCYIIATDLSWTILGMDLLDGPVDVGLSHSDYTVTEVQEAVDASPTSDSDQIALERTRRKVRTAGTFKTPENTGAGVSLNDGKLMRTKVGFGVSNSFELDLWAINRGAPALTVDTTVMVSGKVYVIWQ